MTGCLVNNEQENMSKEVAGTLFKVPALDLNGETEKTHENLNQVYRSMGRHLISRIRQQVCQLLDLDSQHFHYRLPTTHADVVQFCLPLSAECDSLLLLFNDVHNEQVSNWTPVFL
jgi:hypothetical protein